MEVVKTSVCIGCGLEVDPITGLLEVQLRPGGGLDCDNTGDANDGLFVVFPAPPESSVLVTNLPDNCVDLSGNGTAISPLHAALDISEGNCNSLECRGDGLYAPCPNSLVCPRIVGFTGGSFPINLDNPASTYNIFSNCTGGAGCSSCVGNACGNEIQVCLPAADFCCQMRGYWGFRAYGGNVRMAPGFEATMIVTQCLDGTGYVNTTPLHNIKLYNDVSNTNSVIWEVSGINTQEYIEYNPGDCHTFGLQLTIDVETATAPATSSQWVASPEFEFYLHLTPTGCTCS